ncbi:hypothetical protein IHE44_0001970 [Lamprotornis superbus]|uniref:Uncharacterized protein n=1 Tax=Lamprotornis superbus TaxID=245042 RepID=A0A835NI51_9PASS|nr:hypothetical protein IHE44_0001970 [Lamprotornis superbus]
MAPNLSASTESVSPLSLSPAAAVLPLALHRRGEPVPGAWKHGLVSSPLICLEEGPWQLSGALGNTTLMWWYHITSPCLALTNNSRDFHLLPPLAHWQQFSTCEEPHNPNRSLLQGYPNQKPHHALLLVPPGALMKTGWRKVLPNQKEVELCTGCACRKLDLLSGQSSSLAKTSRDKSPGQGSQEQLLLPWMPLGDAECFMGCFALYPPLVLILFSFSPTLFICCPIQQELRSWLNKEPLPLGLSSQSSAESQEDAASAHLSSKSSHHLLPSVQSTMVCRREVGDLEGSCLTCRDTRCLQQADLSHLAMKHCLNVDWYSFLQQEAVVTGIDPTVYTLVIEHSQSTKLTASFTEQSPVCLSPEQIAPAVPPGSTDAAGLAGAAAGMLSRVVVSEVCSLSVPSQWTVGFALLSQGVQGLVLQLLWEMSVGHSPLHGAHHRQLACLLFAAEVPVCCTPAHLQHCWGGTGWAAHRCHWDRQWDIGFMFRSCPSLSFWAGDPISHLLPIRSIGKGLAGSLGSSGESQRGQWHTQMSIFYFMHVLLHTPELSSNVKGTLPCPILFNKPLYFVIHHFLLSLHMKKRLCNILEKIWTVSFPETVILKNKALHLRATWVLAVSGRRSQQNTHGWQGKSLVLKKGLLGVPRALPAYNLLQPLVWSDWASFMPALALAEGCGGNRASWSPEKHLPPGAVMCTRNWVWGPQKEHQRAPGGVFLYQKTLVSEFPNCMQLSGCGCVIVGESIVPLPVEIAKSNHCWVPSSLTAPLAASYCPARWELQVAAALLPVCMSRSSSPTQLHAARGSPAGTDAPFVQKANHDCRDPEPKPESPRQAPKQLCQNLLLFHVVVERSNSTSVTQLVAFRGQASNTGTGSLWLVLRARSHATHDFYLSSCHVTGQVFPGYFRFEWFLILLKIWLTYAGFNCEPEGPVCVSLAELGATIGSDPRVLHTAAFLTSSSSLRCRQCPESADMAMHVHDTRECLRSVSFVPAKLKRSFNRNIPPSKCAGRSGGRDSLQSPLLQRQREAPRTREPGRVGAEHPTGGEGCIAATPQAERTYSCSSVAMTADLTAAVSHYHPQGITGSRNSSAASGVGRSLFAKDWNGLTATENQLWKYQSPCGSRLIQVAPVGSRGGINILLCVTLHFKPVRAPMLVFDIKHIKHKDDVTSCYHKHFTAEDVKNEENFANMLQNTFTAVIYTLLAQ